MIRSEKEIFDRISEINKEVEELNIKLSKIRSNKSFRCGCGKMHKIKDCSVIQAHEYVSPHGCSGGDYWREIEIQVICPETDNKNRFLFNNHDVDWDKRGYYDYNPQMQFKRIYLKLFKEIINDFGEDNRCYWNNSYVDTNREKFGIKIKGQNES